MSLIYLALAALCIQAVAQVFMAIGVLYYVGCFRIASSEKQEPYTDTDQVPVIMFN